MIKLSDITVGPVDKRILNETRYRAELVVREEDIISNDFVAYNIYATLKLREEVWDRIYGDIARKTEEILDRFYRDTDDLTSAIRIELLEMLKPK